MSEVEEYVDSTASRLTVPGEDQSRRRMLAAEIFISVAVVGAAGIVLSLVIHGNWAGLQLPVAIISLSLLAGAECAILEVLDLRKLRLTSGLWHSVWVFVGVTIAVFTFVWITRPIQGFIYEATSYIALTLAIFLVPLAAVAIARDIRTMRRVEN